MKKLMYLAAFAAFALASCEPAPEPVEPIVPEFEKVNVVEETLTANPEGNPAEAEDPTLLLTLDIEAEGAWKIEAFEEYDWIEVTPESGEGSTTLTFVVEGNETDKDRLAEFEVKETITATNADLVNTEDPTTKEVKTYAITVSQVKKESNVLPHALAFLKEIVEKQLLGEDTPAVDNWYVVDESFPGIGLVAVDGGKYDIGTIDGAPLCGLPSTWNLPELTWLNISGKDLNGATLPADWNTPKVQYINMATCNLTGVIPEGFGATSKAVHTIYMHQNALYGALPHYWAAGPVANGGETGTLECLFLGISQNKLKSNEEKLPLVQKGDNCGLGYMIPATMDVRLNIWQNPDNWEAGHANPSRDLVQMKIGGVFECNYIGFEKGWGQERYMKYGNGTADDKETWNDHRYLLDEVNWNFSNLGYAVGGRNDYNGSEWCTAHIPHEVMLTWDEAAAAAYTAEAATKTWE